MEALITGLILAGMSGLTVLAFQNQAGFARLFPFILAAATAIFLGIAIWHGAVLASWMRVDEFIAEDELSKARAALRVAEIPYLWAALSYPLFAGYLWLLLRLPGFLKESGKRERSRKRS